MRPSCSHCQHCGYKRATNCNFFRDAMNLERSLSDFYPVTSRHLERYITTARRTQNVWRRGWNETTRSDGSELCKRKEEGRKHDEGERKLYTECLRTMPFSDRCHPIPCPRLNPVPTVPELRLIGTRPACSVQQPGVVFTTEDGYGVPTFLQ